MIVLLDTSTPTCQIAVVTADQTFNYQWDAGRELARGLLAFVEQSLKKNNGEFTDIAGIGVMKGPGSFTGLRIGLTVANTLADSLNIPIVGEVGEQWQQDATTRLRSGETDGVVLPLYGAQAHITKPTR